MSDTMTTTRRKPRPSRATQPKLRPLDFDQINASAASTIDKVLVDAGADEVAQLHGLADLIRGATSDRDRLRPQVYGRLLSLSLYDNVRGLAKYVGISAQTFHNLKTDALGGQLGMGVSKDELAERARANGVRHFPRALQELPRRAEDHARAVATVTAAHPVRDALLRKLVQEERLSQAQVASIIDVHPSRVNHMVNPPKRG